MRSSFPARSTYARATAEMASIPPRRSYRDLLAIAVSLLCSRTHGSGLESLWTWVFVLPIDDPCRFDICERTLGPRPVLTVMLAGGTVCAGSIHLEFLLAAAPGYPPAGSYARRG